MYQCFVLFYAFPACLGGAFDWLMGVMAQAPPKGAPQLLIHFGLRVCRLAIGWWCLGQDTDRSDEGLAGTVWVGPLTCRGIAWH